MTASVDVQWLLSLLEAVDDLGAAALTNDPGELSAAYWQVEQVLSNWDAAVEVEA